MDLLVAMDVGGMREATGLYARLQRLLHQYSKSAGPLERDALGNECLRIGKRLDVIGFDPGEIDLKAPGAGPSLIA